MQFDTIKQGLMAGLFYFAVVFFAAFGLGVLRAMYVVPLAGPSLAVAIELPIILSLAWVSCRWFMIKCNAETWEDRGVMAALSFSLLIFAEWAIRFVYDWIILGDGTLPPVVATQTFADGLGLAGQVAFGVLGLVAQSACRNTTTFVLLLRFLQRRSRLDANEDPAGFNAAVAAFLAEGA